MAKKTNAIDLSKVIKETLSEYSDEVVEKFNAQIPRVAEDVVKKIEEKAPERTGKYKKSWDIKTENKSRFEQNTIIYSHNYQLPHLLEYSHALRNGGRSKPQEHIAPAEQLAIEELQKEIEEAVENVNIN